MLRLLSFILFVSCVSVANAQTAQEWLQNINAANRSHQFDGVITYEDSSGWQTAKLKHRVIDNVAQQTLELTDGRVPILRRQALYDCPTGQTRWGLWPSVVDLSSLTQGYEFKKLGVDSLLGRSVQVIGLLPKDQFRYGYRLSIDQQTGLLIMVERILGSQLIDKTRFVDFELVDVQSVSDLEGSIERVPETTPCAADQFKSAWQVKWLPLGFEPVGNRVTVQGEEVLMFSDGLASISVFITSPTKPQQVFSGATSIAMYPVKVNEERFMAIAIGEVPMIAIKKLVESVGPAP